MEDLASSFLGLLDEGVVEVLLVLDDFGYLEAVDGGVGDVGELGQGVVAPDDDVLDVLDGGLGGPGELEGEGGRGLPCRCSGCGRAA